MDFKNVLNRAVKENVKKLENDPDIYITRFKGSTLVVDFNLVAMRNMFAVQTDGDSPGLDNKWMFNTINKITQVADIFKATTIIIAKDSRFNWRKKVDKEYKRNRKEGRDKSDIKWDNIWAMFEVIISDLKDNFCCITMEVSNCEADDICAVIGKYVTGKVVVVSSDKDLIQINQNLNTLVFDPFQWKVKTFAGSYGHIKTWDDWIKVSSFIGQEKDNVPHIRPGKRLGESRVKKLFDADKDSLDFMTGDELMRFNKNKVLLDLLHLPTPIEKAIIKELYTLLDEIEVSEDQNEKLHKFITRKRWTGLNKNIGYINSYFNNFESNKDKLRECIL